MLGYTGMALLLVAWVIAWLAWAFMVSASRQAAAQAGPPSGANRETREEMVPPPRIERGTSRSTI